MWFQDNIGKLEKMKAFGFDSWTVDAFIGKMIELHSALDDLTCFKAEPVPLIYNLVHMTVRMYMVFLLFYTRSYFLMISFKST